MKTFTKNAKKNLGLFNIKKKKERKKIFSLICLYQQYLFCHLSDGGQNILTRREVSGLGRGGGGGEIILVNQMKM